MAAASQAGSFFLVFSALYLSRYLSRSELARSAAEQQQSSVSRCHSDLQAPPQSRPKLAPLIHLDLP